MFTNFAINLNQLTADELAALWVAVQRHTEGWKANAIIDAGITNCGVEDFSRELYEVEHCHEAVIA